MGRIFTVRRPAERDTPIRRQVIRAKPDVIATPFTVEQPPPAKREKPTSETP